ncbi:MAG: hypothetical protein J7L39_02855 [Candidatus Aenigmarchaeota archaeon]|nr:hypothetical protein [Candidatus Aenigmarchaeota archaeon]
MKKIRLNTLIYPDELIHYALEKWGLKNKIECVEKNGEYLEIIFKKEMTIDEIGNLLDIILVLTKLG